MSTDNAASSVPLTPQAVLDRLAALHEQRCRESREAVPEVRLTFETCVSDWKFACGWSGLSTLYLGRKMNEMWGLTCSLRAWKTVLEPARKRTLREVCALIADPPAEPQPAETPPDAAEPTQDLDLGRMAAPDPFRLYRCPGCGYSREGLPADAMCPECGQEVDPSLILLYSSAEDMQVLRHWRHRWRQASESVSLMVAIAALAAIAVVGIRQREWGMLAVPGIVVFEICRLLIAGWRESKGGTPPQPEDRPVPWTVAAPRHLRLCPAGYRQSDQYGHVGLYPWARQQGRWRPRMQRVGMRIEEYCAADQPGRRRYVCRTRSDGNSPDTVWFCFTATPAEAERLRALLEEWQTAAEKQLSA